MINIIAYTIMFVIGILAGKLILFINKKKTEKNISIKQKSNKGLIFQIITAIVFLLYAISLKIDFENVTIYKITSLLLGYIYIIIILLIGQIEKKTNNIDKSVLGIGVCVSLLHMIYLYIVMPVRYYIQISSYLIYLVLFIIFCIIDIFIMKKKAERSYTIQILMLYTFMCMFSNEFVMLVVTIILALSVMIYYIARKIKSARLKVVKNEEKLYFHIGYVIGAIHIAVLIFNNFYLL